MTYRSRFLVGLTAAVVCAALGWLLVVRSPAMSGDEHFALAITALLDGDILRADAELRKLPFDEAHLPHRRLLEGGIMLRTGNPERALPWLVAVEPVDELRLPALLLQGECYYRLRRYAEAEMCFLYVIDDNPDQIAARRWLGSVYYDLGTINAAVRQIQDVIRLDPTDFRPHHLLGVISFDLEKYGDAVAAFQAALDCNPPEEFRERLCLELARSHVRLRQYQQAEQALAAASGVANEPVAKTVRAECAVALGEPAVAENLLKEALEVEPNNRDALFLLAGIAQESKRWSDAIATLERILKFSPHDHEARYQLGLVCGQSGDKQRAEVELRLSEESLLLQQRATELYSLADQFPTEPRYRKELAEICEEMGKPELADMWLAAAESLRVRSTMRSSDSAVPKPNAPE